MIGVTVQEASLLAGAGLLELLIGFIFRPVHVRQKKSKDVVDIRKVKWTMIIGGFLVLLAAHFSAFNAYWEYAEGMILDGILVYTGFRV
jgi:hypothetical protein